MQKTYKELQEELLSKTKSNENLTLRIGKLREDLRNCKTMEKRLILQYERVIKEYKSTLHSLLENGWKIVFAKVINKTYHMKGV